ncbi:MAG: hypothetical protein F6J90_08335 [Moorea sp. SIOASIH]|uniref:hypothetical protein n=1 Tax=Moorena sp. SIOASIH TaxID=2607817 RepID=UPI0013BB198E|nr:hypothetical protein [Moorena sp. SIOASIH]NEO36326.1 hypothetical protein [Moorena sp. SIOASIH]
MLCLIYFKVSIQHSAVSCQPLAVVHATLTADINSMIVFCDQKFMGVRELSTDSLGTS